MCLSKCNAALKQIATPRSCVEVNGSIDFESKSSLLQRVLACTVPIVTETIHLCIVDVDIKALARG